MQCKSMLIATLALFLTPAQAFEIKTPDTHGFSLTIKEHNKAVLKTGFRLSFNRGISALPNDDLRAFLKSINLKSVSGRTIQELLIDRKSSLAIGVARKNVTPALIHSKRTKTGRELTIVGSNDKGLRIITPKEVGVYSLKGTPRPFTAVPYAQAKRQKMRVSILLDISGSMQSSLADLKKSTTAFLVELSRINQGILCRITAFNTEFRHSGGFVPAALD